MILPPALAAPLDKGTERHHPIVIVNYVEAFMPSRLHRGVDLPEVAETPSEAVGTIPTDGALSPAPRTDRRAALRTSETPLRAQRPERLGSGT
jgi:hypothetical protein